MDRLVVLRQQDMAALWIRFVNLSRVDHPDGSSTLVLTDDGQPAQLVIEFEPQAILEQVFVLADGRRPGELPNRPAPLCDALFGGRSTLVLRVPPAAAPIPFTAAGLLAWAGLIGVPADTRLECVYGLAFRPAFWPKDVWLNAADAVPSRTAEAYGLWHAALMIRGGSGGPDFTNRAPMELVADEVTGRPGFSNQSPAPTESADRAKIAQASRRIPLAAHELLLSPLGSTLDVNGQWSSELAVGGLREYHQRVVLGRDQSVGMVTSGYLLPFGFPAVLTEITERVAPVGPVGMFGDGATILLKTFQISVVDPVVVYPGAPGLPVQGRAFPFRAVRWTAPYAVYVHTRKNSVAAGTTWINRPGDESAAGRRLFELSAEDYPGNTVTISVPMYFVDEDVAVRPNRALHDAAEAYDREQGATARRVAARIALATEAPGESLVDATALYIGAQDAGPGAVPGAGLAAFPRLAGIDARIPAIDAFARAGSPAPGGGPQLMLAPNYLTSGFGPSGVYAQVNRPQAFLPPARGSGGLANLNVNVVGLSKSCGLVGGSAAAQAEALDHGFSPEKFFPTSVPDPTGYLPPKLLGFIDLVAIVAPAPPGDREKVPRVATDVITEPAPGTGLPVPIQVRSTVNWRPAVKAGTSSGILHTGAQTVLEIRCVTTADLRGGSPATDVFGELRDFTLVFLGGLLNVMFERVTFTSHAGAPPSLDAKIKAISPLAGDAEKSGLAFFGRLLRLLPDTSNGPRIVHTADSISAEYALALPEVSMGVFLLQNLAVSCSVTVPLDGKPVRARFAVCSRPDPFLLTVSLFGGGGFLALEVAGTELEVLEAQLEFAAAASLDLLVASASVAVTAGIYLRIEDGAPHTEGFFRAVGELDVLGLVNVSVEIYLSLSFEIVQPGAQKRFTGHAEITVRVRVLFCAKSLTIPVTRSFGGGSDPTFDAAYPTADPWRAHCAAFAPLVTP